MRQSIRLGTFAGVAVGVNWSVLVIVVLFAWELAYYVLPTTSGSPSVADWIAGVIGAVVLLASLLAHEVSHALVARHNGIGVRSITLFMFGGIAQLEGEAHTAGADFRIAAMGPATSVLLAGVFAAAQAVLIAAGGHGLPVNVLSWLWTINLFLAAFNLIPAAPLDGGRILRAGLWRHWGDRVRASVTAARAGRGFAAVLIALGVLALFYEGFIGLWPALIGLFLYSAARAEEQYALAQGALANLSVGQVMTPHPPAVPDRTTVEELVRQYLWQYRGDAVVVTDENGRLAGVVTAQAVSALPLERRRLTTLAEIALPLAVLPVAGPDEPMNVLLERMASSGGHPALVLDPDNRLAGIVTAADVQRAAQLTMGRQSKGTGRR
jgi:Zn-dependent protease/CBS domain-containing protein